MTTPELLGRELAFPLVPPKGLIYTGLTKREYIAIQAMVGLLLAGNGVKKELKDLNFTNHELIAKDSVAYADALLIQLSKEKTE